MNWDQHMRRRFWKGFVLGAAWTVVVLIGFVLWLARVP
jgi:hypothetical protein